MERKPFNIYQISLFKNKFNYKIKPNIRVGLFKPAPFFVMLVTLGLICGWLLFEYIAPPAA